MKKNTLAVLIAILCLLGSSLIASASLAVYSYSGTTTTTGGGKSLSTTHTGTMVIDLDTMAATYVGQFSTGSGKTLKNYWVSAPLSNTINTQVLGPKGATSTVLAKVENPGSRYTGSLVHFESAIGLNSQLTIRNKGTTEQATLPKTLTSPGLVITEDSKYDYIAQSNGTYTFNSTATLAYNNANKTFSAVIAELVKAYKAKNYTQWSPSNLVGMPTPKPTPKPTPTPTIFPAPSGFKNIIGGVIKSGGKISGQEEAFLGQSVSGFQIAQYETTWREWVRIRDWAKNNGYDIGSIGSGQGEDYPVTELNWFDALKWCNAKSEAEGLTPVYITKLNTYKSGELIPTVNTNANGYRLPTELEWEWAARGGVSSQGYTYSGSNNVDSVAWYYSNSGTLYSPGTDNTKSVGKKQSNELGIYDMSGNVQEWCFDTFAFGNSTTARARGGSSSSYNVGCTVIVRGHYDVEDRWSNLGFRLARNNSVYTKPTSTITPAN